MKNKILIRHMIIGMVVILIDQITKWITVANLQHLQTKVVVPNFFHFTFVKNSGAAWGIFNNNTLLLTVISIGILMLFSYMYFTKKDKVIRGFLLFIIAGAIGNLIDRIRLGYVIDFLDFHILNYNFPVFNIADIAVSLATIGLFVYIFLGENK